MKIPILKLPYTEEDIDFIKEEIEKILRSGTLTMGGRVRAFEEQFASFCGVNYALATNSGTSSLEIILRTINVDKKTVVMPSNTYMATPLAAIKAGGKVIFTECEGENLQMSPDDLKRKIRKDTKAVVIVHIGGIISPKMEEILNICSEYNVPLVEDAAHAHGSEYNNIKAGNIGIAASFSFYPTKILTTAEGGMITTNDERIYKNAIVLREHGKSGLKPNIHTDIGDNWRFSEIHAALGLQQMKKVEYIVSERTRLAKLYDNLLDVNNGVERIIIPDHVKSSYYKYIVFLPSYVDRQFIKQQLFKEYNISLTGEVYANPCHSQPVFKKHPDKIINGSDDQFPVTNDVCKHHICLPLYPGLTNQNVQYIVESLKKVFKKQIKKSLIN